MARAAPYDASMHVHDEVAAQVEVPASPERPIALRPFRGVRLSPQKVANPATARAFARPYRDVAKRLSQWQRDGYVDIDLEPALYLHEYTAHGMTIRGLVGGLELSTRATSPSERAVFPHEAIHPEQADELAARMHEMGINPAPILLVHRGPESIRQAQKAVMESPAHVDYTDRSGQQHRIWRITDAETLQVIKDGLALGAFVIADGHHRYAAYLRLQESHPGTPWDRGLTMVVDQDDTPFFLGAIHRTFTGSSLNALTDAVTASGGTYVRLTADEAVKALAPHTVIATDREQWISIAIPALETTAVEYLHEVVVPHLTHSNVTHHHSVDDAVSVAGPSTVAVMLPAPEYALLDRAMREGRLLPEKATSFQPKPNLGVLMRSVDSELMAPPA